MFTKHNRYTHTNGLNRTNSPIKRAKPPVQSTVPVVSGCTEHKERLVGATVVFFLQGAQKSDGLSFCLCEGLLSAPPYKIVKVDLVSFDSSTRPMLIKSEKYFLIGSCSIAGTIKSTPGW